MRDTTVKNCEEDHQFSLIFRRSSLKYHLPKDTLYEKDIISLSKAILNLTDKEAQNLSVQLRELFSKSNAKSAQLDLALLARETINRINNKINDNFTSFFESFYLSLLTKSESIVFRLKNLQKCDWITKKNKFAATIDYILTTITEGDLHDLDNEEISNHATAKLYRKQELGFLVQYSQIETKNQREKDVTFIRSNTKKYTNYFKHMHGSMGSKFKKRRSTSLSTLVSPSIVARLHTQLSKIDQTDFNIFDLDEIIGKKAVIFLAQEILSKCDMVKQEMVSSEILNNFIIEIVENYDRDNAIYHNDLHAGDVMQTLYTMLIKGNLESVRSYYQ